MSIHWSFQIIRGLLQDPQEMWLIDKKSEHPGEYASRHILNCMDHFCFFHGSEKSFIISYKAEWDQYFKITCWGGATEVLQFPFLKSKYQRSTAKVFSNYRNLGSQQSRNRLEGWVGTRSVRISTKRRQEGVWSCRWIRGGKGGRYECLWGWSGWGSNGWEWQAEPWEVKIAPSKRDWDC